MHLPDTTEDQVTARQRLAFEEFFYLQLALQMRRNEVKQELGISFPVSTLGVRAMEEGESPRGSRPDSVSFSVLTCRWRLRSSVPRWKRARATSSLVAS